MMLKSPSKNKLKPNANFFCLFRQKVNFKFQLANRCCVFPGSRLLLHGGGDKGIIGLAFGGELLHLDEESDTVAHKLEEVNLGVANTIGIGDVVGAVVGGSVDTTGTTLEWRVVEVEEVEMVMERRERVGRN